MPPLLIDLAAVPEEPGAEPGHLTVPQPAPLVLFLKAHVRSYTRKDGVFVTAHDDKRPAAKPRSRPAAVPAAYAWVSPEHLALAREVHAVTAAGWSEFQPGAVGLRVVPEGDEAKHEVGMKPPSSWHWNDGAPTKRSVGGTSTIGLRSASFGDVLTALHYLGALGKAGPRGYYVGDKVALIAGTSSKSGDDLGEKIIKNGRVRGAWSLPNVPRQW